MIKRLYALFVISFSKIAIGQTDKIIPKRKVYFGLEQDILPYVLNGFIGTTWIGIKFSLGGGYNIPLWKGLYTSPWLALHTRIL